MHGCKLTGRVYEGGPYRAGVTRMRNIVTKGRKTQPLRLAPMDRTYSDAPGVRKRYSFSYSEMVTLGSAYLCRLEGSFPAGREFAEPFLVQYSP
jgi:hypothetical protein